VPRSRPPAPAGRAARVLIAALAGVAAWAVGGQILPALPIGARTVLLLAVFTYGAGALAAGWVSGDLPRLERAIVLMSLGVATAPALADVLARVGGLTMFPLVVTIAAAVELLAGRSSGGRASHVGWPAVLLIATLAAGTGSVTFAHRLEKRPAGITVYGDYDSVDLSYYAAITAELSHTDPPQAPFYSGHPLNYSYYPAYLLTLVHRFGAVPILDLNFRWAWPVLLTVGALMLFVLVSAVSTTGAAVLAASLFLVGGDFSWAFATWLPHDTYLFDWLLWPTNFLAPTMEVLHFSTWTGAMPVLFVGFYAFARSRRTVDGWMAVACLAWGILVEFKPFAFGMVIAGLGAAAVALWIARPADHASGTRLRAARPAMATAAGTLVVATPFLYQIVTLYAESRGHLVIDWFRLPRLMLDKLALTEVFTRAAAALGATGRLQHVIVLALATPLFLFGGFGVRWLGVPRILRSARRRGTETFAARVENGTVWPVLAWTIIAGVLVPFVVVTDPYQDSIQFYQTSLFLMWIFTGVALATWAARRSRATAAAAVALVFALAVPSSIHYLDVKWGEGPAHPLLTISAAEITGAEYLHDLPANGTVILHDRPLDPSPIAILSERRVVLAWARYVTGSEARQDDVDRFFASSDRPATEAISTLDRYHVTHIVVRPSRDHVNAQVLASLHQVLALPDLVIYAR
jgi:hypothetical protein